MSRGGAGPFTIGQWITESASRTPERVAIEYLDRLITYRDLDDGSTRLARGLLAHGLGHADRIVTLTENRLEQVELFFACAKAGLILAPLNCHSSADELARQLESFTPALAIASQTHADRLSKACSLVGANPPLSVETIADSLERHSNLVDLPLVGDDDGLLLISTSGTTGRPKGSLLTHANCYWTNRSLDLSIPISADDVVLQVLPQYHVGGWNVQPLLAWSKGATVVLEPTFNPDRVFDLVEKRHVTTMMGVPTTYLMLAQHPRFNDVDFSSLRSVVVGGASMPVSLLDRWHERGVEVVQGYGLTEASPNVFCLGPEDASTHVGSVGKPYAHVQVALRDVATGDLVADAGRGEILVRGPNVFPGYWNDSLATTGTFIDGWLRTGDVADRDAAGYYWICGRNKEMYVSGGENVYPSEVERVLCLHPDILEAAVISIEHERWGESGRAFVVAQPGIDVDVDDVITHCRTHLASFKVPTEIEVVGDLPRSPLGKIDKGRLRG